MILSQTLFARGLVAVAVTALLSSPLGCGSKRMQVGAPAPPWMDPAIDQEAQKLAPGAARVADFTARADEGQKAEFPVTLEAGRCYVFVLVGEKDLEGIELEVEAAGGDELGDASGETKLTLSACAKRSGPHVLKTKLDEGEGAFKLAVFAKGGPSPAAAPPPPPPSAAPEAQ
jgi:hypothetical protein